MTEGRSPPRTLLPDTVGSGHRKPTSLQGLAHQATTDRPPRVRELDGGLDAGLLLACWRDLNTQAASGGAGLTAHADEAKLQANSTALVRRLKPHRDRANRRRRGYIPQGSGAERPLGSPAREDKLVQRACPTLLRASYAPDFLACSAGARPGRGALEAVRDLPFARQDGPYGYLVEADGNGFFGHRDHTRLLTMRRERSDARAVLRLIRNGLKAGVPETDGRVGPPATGSPHGGGRAPVLAQGSLHGALDGWFAAKVQTPGRGEARLCRSAEDWGGACRSQDEAARC
jgi:RNA-directed DNA polymerase